MLLANYSLNCLQEHQKFLTVFKISGNCDFILACGITSTWPLFRSFLHKNLKMSHPSQESFLKSLFSLNDWYLRIFIKLISKVIFFLTNSFLWVKGDKIILSIVHVVAKTSCPDKF